jgi:Oxidoreductase-like protein, N-terminal
MPDLTTQLTPPADPAPVPPEKPDPGDCCGGGCVRCVYDVYEDALERYQAALLAWNGGRG